MKKVTGAQAIRILKGGGQVKWKSPDGMIIFNMSSSGYVQFDMDWFKQPVNAFSSFLDDLRSGEKRFIPIEP